MADTERLLDDAALEHRTWRQAGPEVWRPWIMPQRFKPIVPTAMQGVPAASGIYMLCAADDTMVYIGRAGNLHRRVRQHWDAKRFRGGMHFTYFTFLPVPAVALHDVEVAHIYALEPPANRLYEPIRWPGHAAMVAAIVEAWSPA